jgi:hypothetical protein
MLLRALKEDSEDDLYFEGGQHKRDLLDQLGAGTLPHEALAQVGCGAGV